MDAPVLSARGIVKRFPGVVANDGVDLDVRRGEVHTVLGENGAGKSTLAAVLSGYYRPDEGELRVDGERVTLHSPRDGLARGIGMVHQHFRLVDRFTVAENIALGDGSQPVVLDTSRLEREVTALGERFGLSIDPRARVGDLSVGERQRVEIVNTLYRGADVLLLDEPTAVLTPREVDVLFATVRALRAAGRAVVFISHKLGEVMEVSDRITVMRNGRVTGDVRAADTDARELARMMVGRDVDLSPRRAPRAPAAPMLRVRLDGIELDVRAGELVGVAGVAGNGQLELAETIAGLRTPPAGRVEIGGVDVTGRGARAARRAGLAYVPEDRLGTGLAPSLTIAENLLLTRRRGFFVNRRRAAAQARDAIERFDIKASGPDAVTRVLSGGNAQRVLLARELAGEPRVLVAAAPTRGLDVGATEAVRELLDAFRARGGAVLLLSEDLDEVLALSDRIVVLYRGRIAHETPGDGADVEQIGYAMAGVV
ncbi:MAG TPA: ABC transporter ATP-binding protein [Acidimicrobiales bacterium]|nr:ABC transporter ATP-binding protein [Acidimicrobiales bacterium]